MTKTQPAHEVRFGSIKATIWENPVGDGIKYNVTFSRIYKDGEEWKSTESFGREDLLLVAKVADQAHSWIYEQRPVKETPAPQKFASQPQAAPRKAMPAAGRVV